MEERHGAESLCYCGAKSGSHAASQLPRYREDKGSNFGLRGQRKGLSRPKRGAWLNRRQLVPPSIEYLNKGVLENVHRGGRIVEQ
jgi:hypothetical protein